MAMDGTILGTEIAGIITASNASDEMEAQILETWQKIAGAIISHITTYGVVNVTVDTTGSAAKQTGTGVGGIS